MQGGGVEKTAEIFWGRSASWKREQREGVNNIRECIV